MEPIQHWQIADHAASPTDRATPPTGQTTIAIPFTVSTPGQYTLPPMELAWFDPIPQKYHSEKTDSLIVHVLAAPTPTPPSQLAPTSPTPASPQTTFPTWIIPTILAALALLLLILRTGRRSRQTTLIPTTPEPILPTENRSLADIKQTLNHFLQTRLHTDAWAEEDLLHLLQQKDPSLAEKVIPLVDTCNKLLYSPHRPDPDALARLNTRLDEILKT